MTDQPVNESLSIQSNASAGPPSPCVGVCRLDQEQICQGCFRSLAEIGRWSIATPVEKEVILREVHRRRMWQSAMRANQLPTPSS